MKSLFAILALLLEVLQCQAQQPIFLANPSFEDRPKYNHVPKGWKYCAVPGETPPDTHPVVDGYFQVYRKPQDGKSYLGLVTRDNGTTELVSQKLNYALEAEKCYSFSIHICRADRYLSPNRRNGQLTNFIQPTVLRIWGGDRGCEMKELLAVSPPIENFNWLSYKFIFYATQTLETLTLEAYYLEGSSDTYNGNLLLDNCSPIVPIDCESKKPLVDMDNLVIPGYKSSGSDENDANLANPNYLIGNDSMDIDFSLFVQLSSPDLLSKYINSNCGHFGFLPGKSKLSPSANYHLSELAYNVERFHNQHLSLALSDQKVRLTKKRHRQIKKTLLDAGLPKEKFSIKHLAEYGDDKEWHCGELELWLKVEALR